MKRRKTLRTVSIRPPLRPRAPRSRFYWLESILRFIQFVPAVAVAGLYGVDLSNVRDAHKRADSRWIYAVVVAGISAITLIAFKIPVLGQQRLFCWWWEFVVLLVRDLAFWKRKQKADWPIELCGQYYLVSLRRCTCLGMSDTVMGYRG